uniref:Uncharacterized protein n=1 Tax=Rhizophora mucronata TaxID=61149 RepID=A0A2P2N7H9_RHIMU
MVFILLFTIPCFCPVSWFSLWCFGALAKFCFVLLFLQVMSPHKILFWSGTSLSLSLLD